MTSEEDDGEIKTTAVAEEASDMTKPKNEKALKLSSSVSDLVRLLAAVSGANGGVHDDDDYEDFEDEDLHEGGHKSPKPFLKGLKLCIL